ncbi:hypothetical protein BUALT_Bualt10G0024300 [Buddleja alternifolia]|uniref:Retrotransposon gag domain-containing protein n=1 Tax=Buddleja alternifolia TaxID=168488 RepID=A0AAV6X686_9LAMI|nr:hypothetical protein BUALT_Bualt10G0024300 [Buddleja alternifolia]
MREMRQRLGVSVYNQPKGILFGPQILPDELPNSFRTPNMSEYDGSSYPNEHLWKFENCALLNQYSDGVKCWVFLTTLTRSAQQWFNQLAPNSINSFKKFSSMFLHQFSSSKKYQNTSLSLFNMRQKANEPLQGYIQRFNTVALEVAPANAEVLSNAFAQGLKDGNLFRSLAKKPAFSFDNMLATVEKYVNIEEAAMMKGAESLPPNKDADE